MTGRSNKKEVFQELQALYEKMEAEYNRVAHRIGLNCLGCQDNCCKSYFRHHTYLEWAYLWQGLRRIDPSRLQSFQQKAREYVEKSKYMLENNQTPRIMCPLNEEGWCAVYEHRLMICRLHGVPNRVRMPDGRTRTFPGCSVCREVTRKWEQVPYLDRTPLYVELASLERRFLGRKRISLGKVDMTLADMLLQGPPSIAAPPEED